jgi:hypothetical protein
MLCFKLETLYDESRIEAATTLDRQRTARCRLLQRRIADSMLLVGERCLELLRAGQVAGKCDGGGDEVENKDDDNRPLYTTRSRKMDEHWRQVFIYLITPLMNPNNSPSLRESKRECVSEWPACYATF